MTYKIPYKVIEIYWNNTDILSVYAVVTEEEGLEEYDGIQSQIVAEYLKVT